MQGGLGRVTRNADAHFHADDCQLPGQTHSDLLLSLRLTSFYPKFVRCTLRTGQIALICTGEELAPYRWRDAWLRRSSPLANGIPIRIVQQTLSNMNELNGKPRWRTERQRILQPIHQDQPFGAQLAKERVRLASEKGVKT